MPVDNSSDVNLELLLKSSLELSPDCFSITRDGITIYCNDNFAKSLFGLPKDQVVGQHYRDLLKRAWRAKEGGIIDFEDFDSWIARLDKIIQETPVSQFEMDLNDGRWLKMTRTVLDNGYIVTIGVDITELKKTQQELQQNIEHIKQLANTDQLTGISNRRAFESIAKHEIAIATRYRQPLSLLALDIDFFKRINDTYGHEGGDNILKLFSEFCSNVIRESDTLCRIGGEEFVILLPMTKLSDACELAERLCDGVSRYPFYLASQDKEISVTVSIGASKLIMSDLNINDVVARADTALYQAKISGRNRVCSSEVMLDAM